MTVRWIVRRYVRNGPTCVTDGTHVEILRRVRHTRSEDKNIQNQISLGGPACNTDDGGERPATTAATPWDASTSDASTATSNIRIPCRSIMGCTWDDASSSNASRTWVSLACRLGDALRSRRSRGCLLFARMFAFLFSLFLASAGVVQTHTFLRE